MNNLISVGIWAFGSIPDRFCEKGYQEKKSFAEKVNAASKVKGLDGVEIHYNGDINKNNAYEAKQIIEASGLKVSAINCEIFGDSMFKKGALTSRNNEIRQKAVDLIKEASEITEFFGASLVNIWPGAEGHDYPFQVNYFQQWDVLIESINEFIVTKPDVRFSLEYKLREPRVRSTISTAGTALVVVKELNHENLGVTIDFGHSLQARENPAEAVTLLQRYGKLFHVHVNDNSRDWDDDLIVNSYHIWETLEFIYYLKKANYTGWISLDVAPARENQIDAVEYCIESIKNMSALIEEIDTEELHQALYDMDAVKAHRFISSKLFR
ncbi:sugar phosphate isomerase/epimerase family protein [Brevibacillus sp. NRS-1366]|uniref:sugar phosphate isomerase/epimerase family protein n=1 Tax=Brevibacillus sp. NRS-1366 TaxID=3233899 RepID=UPI003D1EDA98